MKMVYDKKETENILNMLLSKDTDNNYLAYQLINNSDVEKYKGNLILLYRYSKIKNEQWETNCPKIWKKIKDMILAVGPLTSPKCLTLLKNVKATNDCMELFMELFVKDMIGYLDDLGYSTDKFDISIKFKD